MTTLQHTPGPWKTRRANFLGNVDIITPNHTLVAVAACEDWGYESAPRKETQGNAQLIAAAPELLEALRQAQRALNAAPRFRVDDTDSYAIAAIVDRAIHSATAA